jgi:hypothetical protein
MREGDGDFQTKNADADENANHLRVPRCLMGEHPEAEGYREAMVESCQKSKVKR